MKSEKVDVLVIGAGPSGTVAASIIKKAGYSVKIIEKMKFPRFVIGESLLPRCMEALEEAGFLEAVKQKKFQEKFGAKFVHDGKISDFFFADQYTKGWTWTWQVPRGEFGDHEPGLVQVVAGGLLRKWGAAATVFLPLAPRSAVRMRNDERDVNSRPAVM